MTKRLSIVRTKFIFKTIKILTLESEFILHKIIINMIEFGLLNNKEKYDFLL